MEYNHLSMDMDYGVPYGTSYSITLWIESLPPAIPTRVKRYDLAYNLRGNKKLPKSKTQNPPTLSYMRLCRWVLCPYIKPYTLSPISNIIAGGGSPEGPTLGARARILRPLVATASVASPYANLV